MLGQVLTWNLVFIGLVRGLVIALVAMGVVLVYRSSRVINFAVGGLGLPATALLGVMVANQGWPYWPALVAALAVGMLTGTVVELAVIRRLFVAPRVIVLVATIGVAQLAQAVTRTLPGYRSGRTVTTFPTPISSTWSLPGDITVKGSQLLVVVVVPVITLALWWLLGHTRFGEAVRAAATNSDLARMTGINPKLVSTGVWTIAGFLSTMSVILIATDIGGADLTLVGNDTLLRGMTAALVGGMVSFPVAVAAAVAIGVGEQVLLFNFPRETGLLQFGLFVVVLVFVGIVSRRDGTGGESFQFAPRVQAIPEHLRRIWWVRNMASLTGALALVVAVALPLVLTQSARHLTYSTILAFALAAVSVTILTGWAGQLSLGQMAFGGIGALSAAALVRGASVDVGWRDARVLQGTLPEVPFWLAILLGAVVACAVATVIGIGALRVRGLLLAVSTLAFAIAGQAYLFRRPIFTMGRSTARLPREAIGPLDITERNRAYYFLTLGVLVVVVAAAAHLRRSGIGRTIVGVRENEAAASALTVSPVRAKLTSFALAGFVAGLAGALLGGLVVTIAFAERFFRVTDSLMLVSMAVIGGLGSLGGAVMGALWVVGLPAFWPRNDTVPLFVSSIGVLVIVLYIPGGFVQIGQTAQASLLRWLDRRLPAPPTKTRTAPPASLARTRRDAPVDRNTDGSVLATKGLGVRFGGNVAVDGVDFHAAPGEIVGLIGTNGAGKSTLLNAVGGYVPASGTVHLLGRDVSGFAPHRRARAGLGRTFQAATLFPELTVRQTIELALEARGRTSFWGTLLWLPPARRAERVRRAEAAELVDFLGLGRYADRFVAELSTGTRRIVELAAVLAVAPRVICLDEPTAGVAQREAEAFGPLIRQVQRELDATLVIVEHDLPMIMELSDRVYCMEAGRVIAEGPAHAVRENPLVVASYLGTDARAIQRSGAAAPTP